MHFGETVLIIVVVYLGNIHTSSANFVEDYQWPQDDLNRKISTAEPVSTTPQQIFPDISEAPSPAATVTNNVATTNREIRKPPDSFLFYFLVVLVVAVLVVIVIVVARRCRHSISLPYHQAGARAGESP